MDDGLTAALAALMLAACSGGSVDGDDGEAAGPQAQRSFTLSGFDKVDLAGPDNVRVMTGSAFSVRAEGPQDVIDKLKLEVVDGTLRVGRERSSNWKWGRNPRATVTVTLPNATGASVSGAGGLTLDRGTGDFTATISGAGDLAVGRIDGGNVTLKLSGTGDIAAAGVARTLNASVSGAGSIRAEELVARQGKVSLSGVGDVAVRIDGPAQVSVSGVGSARLGPNSVCTTRKSGVGSVECGSGGR
ncbi:DUF2807 domain-containing protein [Sphingomonas sp. S1-29]|uniref:head GIN domain-containing protein n=1 Tax=Sphingomonas sp. S1-29 TaxID=2991074 RepID=UPI00223EE8EA|nr:head GIN domain-containing protein [Sphingomonas sp. S1-29]UZK69107.1 DUF2807 domain-containing protein [Sphingomonas sp. S1-29]